MEIKLEVSKRERLELQTVIHTDSGIVRLCAAGWLLNLNCRSRLKRAFSESYRPPKRARVMTILPTVCGKALIPKLLVAFPRALAIASPGPADFSVSQTVARAATLDCEGDRSCRTRK